MKQHYQRIMPYGGGDETPPLKMRCASCQRRRLKTELVRESNERSRYYEQWVCNDTPGCFDGPYPDDTLPVVFDDYGPVEN